MIATLAHWITVSVESVLTLTGAVKLMLIVTTVMRVQVTRVLEVLVPSLVLFAMILMPAPPMDAFLLPVAPPLRLSVTMLMPAPPMDAFLLPVAPQLR